MRDIRLGLGNYYYYVNESYNIVLKVEKDDELDKYNYDSGNYYHRFDGAFEYANRNNIN